jgi:hypothetical protein
MSIRDLTDEELNRTLAEARVTEAEARKRKEDAQREFLRRHGKEIGTSVDMGGVVVELQRNRRFNEDLARTVLTAEQLEAISVPKLDSKKAAEVLDPEDYDRCMKQGSPRFSIGLGFK